MSQLRKISISMVAALMALSSSGYRVYAEETVEEEPVVVEEAVEEIAEEEAEAEPAEVAEEAAAEETTDAYEATFAGVVTDAGEYVDSMTIDFGALEISGLDKETFTVYMTSTVDYGAAKGQPYPYYDASKPLPVVKTEAEGGLVKVYFDQSAAPVLTWLGEGRNYPAILSFTIEQNKPLKTVGADGKAIDFTATYTCDATSWADLENAELAKFTDVQDEINYQFHKGTNDKLIVFFHGNGEGDFPTKATNNNVAQILANRGGAAWVSDEAQEVFGDASVMAFQAPNMWYFAVKDGLLEPVYNEIQAVIAENGINPDEVYLSGASAGGFMSTRMIIAYPDLFKAAMINCPALDAANARTETTTAIPTDKEIASLKDSKTAIWLVQGETDSSVDPELCSKRIWNLITDDQVVTAKTYAGDKGIASGFTTYETADGKYKLSLYETFDLGEVTGISGETRQGGKLKFAEDYDQDGVYTEVKYSDHWSWIYTLRNNPEAADGTHIWQWANEYEPAVEIEGTQTVIVTGDDWGPAVEKTIIKPEAAVDADSLIVDNFTVIETKETPDWAHGGVPTTATAPRTVLDVYASDENGEKAEGGEYITVVMYISPSEGSPFFYELGSGFNRWVDEYNLEVTAQVKADGKVAKLHADTDIDFYDNDMWASSPADDFNQDVFNATDGTPIVYGEWVPEDGGQDKALFIWLHGAGEGTNKGKNDNYIDLLGNEVTAFVSDEFQDLFGGAYVVTPQAPTMWMDGGDGAYQNGDKGSCYAEALFEFIEDYVGSHLDIDPNRVIIGGCSNGGYMTMEMILKHPDYFYKAYPICEAFYDEYITDEQIQALADSEMGIWFTFADADTTVDPTKTSIPTYNRLKEAGADVHKTEWADVHDTTGRFTDAEGNPYVYAGHWSWIYFDNNDNVCDDHGENEWEWLAELPDNSGAVIRGTQVIRLTGDDWGAGIDKSILHLTKEIDPESVARDDFTVMQAMNNGAATERTVVKAYASDAEGNEVDEASEYVTVELRISPVEGNPIVWSMQTWTNSWADPYELTVSIKDGQDINAVDGTKIVGIATNTVFDVKEINNPEVLIPQLDGYVYDTYEANDGLVIPYGLYAPAEDDKKNALIIWNHGVGERGSDPRIALLGNEVTALNGEEFQAIFEGAYVLVPQTPASTAGKDIVKGKIELIEDLLAENPDIDPNRVIVGGCSMGGGQTMNMIYRRADLFAAAYPVCPASTSSQVPDEYIENLSKLPIWFTHCVADDTVNYKNTTEALIERIKATGNEEVHLSAFDDVHDTTGRFNDLTADGSDYQYATHWSWVYFDNNECFCDECGQNEWEWLAQQNRMNQMDAGVYVTENPDEDSNSGYIATFVYKTDEDLEKVTVFGGFQFFTEEEGDRYLTGYTGGIKLKDAYQAAEDEDVMYPYGYDPISGKGQLEYELNEVIDGVWTVSLPLPADQWFYAYNITKDGVTTKVEDPTNPYTLNPNNGNNSGWCVFWTGTPEDALGEMGRTYPRTDEKVGTYEYKMYTNVKGDEAPIVVYLPYGYDSSKTYPVLYISHGGGGNEMDWPTVGAVKNIFDNAIADGEVDPTIVVSMNNTELGWNYDNIRDNLQYHLFPYMEENYGASADAKDRAFAGLSMGGLTATNIFTYAADQFGYIGIWSATNGNLDVASVPNNDYPTVMLGAGKMDFGNGGYPGLIAKAAEAGLDWSDDMYYTNDAHNWFCWPDLLSTFASKYLWSDADKAANVEYEESEPGANVDGKKVTFVYEDDDDRNAVKVTFQGNFQWYKWEDVDGYDAAGDNSHMHNVNAYGYEEGMFNTGYGINGDTAVYELYQTSDEHFELALDLPGNLYYYDYTVTYADGSKKTIKDPANMPEPNPANGHDAGHSLVYVGSADDTTKGQEYIYPRTDDKTGSYEFVPYKAVDGTTQYLGVYLPKDYDEANTYKVVYVSHGGGGQENEWMTIGAVPNILDNLIADGEVEPTIAVTMDNTYFGWNYDTIAKNFEEAIFPYMEKNYSVSGRAEDRALCGLSMGSMTTSTLMLKYTDMFGYYGAFSGANIVEAADEEELAKKVIYLSAGAIDMAYYQSKPVGPGKTVDLANLLKDLGISFNNGTDEPDVLGGAHDWGVWRESFSIFAKDYLWTLDDDRFIDVRDESKYYYNAVYWARDLGITKGYAADNTFRPDEGCTRAQMVTFLWRMAGKPEPSASAKKFPDVASNQYYYKAVLWAAETGITHGYADGTFKPDDVCLREHAVTFLYRYAGQPAPKTAVNPFNDVKASDYYYKATLWANEEGIANGYSTGSHAGGFGPKLECLREHIVTFLYRYAK
ncbi:MAG: S-layer homology domain-containing protein [Solobacterium sp.]|nr:S-layer homology domain-containing protein [Solobacterium sp.]